MSIFSSVNSVYSVLHEFVYSSTKTPTFLCTHCVITVLLLLIRGLAQFSWRSTRAAISSWNEPRHWYSLPLDSLSDYKSVVTVGWTTRQGTALS